MAINLNGANKAEVLAALFNNSQPLGMGFLQPHRNPMTKEEAEELLKSQTYFDYVRGRVMKVDLSRDQLEERLYDRDNGPGAAYEAMKATPHASTGSPTGSTRAPRRNSRSSASTRRATTTSATSTARSR